jgi:hypothetical protein
MVWECGINLFGSEYGPLLGSLEHGTERCGPTGWLEFLPQLRKNSFLQNTLLYGFNYSTTILVFSVIQICT